MRQHKFKPNVVVPYEELGITAYEFNKRLIREYGRSKLFGKDGFLNHREYCIAVSLLLDKMKRPKESYWAWYSENRKHLNFLGEDK